MLLLSELWKKWRIEGLDRNTGVREQGTGNRERQTKGQRRRFWLRQNDERKTCNRRSFDSALRVSLRMTNLKTTTGILRCAQNDKGNDGDSGCARMTG